MDLPEPDTSSSGSSSTIGRSTRRSSTECFVDDEQVTSSDGSFYGGWATVNVTGPFKGAPGTSHW